MNLRNGHLVMYNVTVADVIRNALQENEDTYFQHIYLSEVLGRIIDHIAKTDQEKLDIAAPYTWTLENKP